MSLYIPHIDMPRNCQECFVCTRCDGVCDIADDEVEYSVLKRPDGCLLFEVQPHGRLIDEGDLFPHVHMISDMNDVVDVEDIIRAPTIIPADKEAGDG